MNNELFVHDGKLYNLKEEDHILFPNELPAQSFLPAIRWSGTPLSVERVLWPVYAFFEWAYSVSRGESHAQLYYDFGTTEWKAWAFPQKWSAGLSTTTIDNHPDIEPQSRALGAGAVNLGSIHNHCTVSAGQSSTDKGDELHARKNGIHITIGHLTQAKYDVDARCVVKTVQTQAILSDWIEMPKGWRELPFELRETAAKYLLSRPAPAGTAFPEQWKANLIQEQLPARTHHQVPTPWLGHSIHIGKQEKKTHKPCNIREANGNEDRMMDDFLEAIEKHSVDIERAVEVFALYLLQEKSTVMDDILNGLWASSDRFFHE